MKSIFTCGLLISFLASIACQLDAPSAPNFAAKPVAETSCYAIQFECQFPAEGVDANGVYWTALQNNLTFHVLADSTVDVVEREGNRSRRYRGMDILTVSEGACTIRHPQITDTTHVRLYKGKVYEDRLGRYYLTQNGEQYRINRRYVTDEDEITPPREITWHRDFVDLWNQDEPRPNGTTEFRNREWHVYYLPLNFSRAAIDTLLSVPKDDRPFLDPLVVEVECLSDSNDISPSEEGTAVVRDVSAVSQASGSTSCTAAAVLTYRGELYVPTSIDYGTTPDGSDTACGALTPENAFFANDGNCPAGETPGCQRFTPQDGTGADIHLWLCSACQ